MGHAAICRIKSRSSAPTYIITPRIIITLDIPQKRIRCCIERAIPRYENIIEITNTLSMDRDFSTKYPEKNCIPASWPWKCQMDVPNMQEMMIYIRVVYKLSESPISRLRLCNTPRSRINRDTTRTKNNIHGAVSCGIILRIDTLFVCIIS